MGTPEFARTVLEGLLEAGEPVVAAVSQPDRPRGRNPRPQPPPVAELARERGIELVQPERLRGNADFLDWLRAHRPDVVAVAAYGKILPAEVLAVPALGCLNVHASLLPRHRGAAPIQHAILAGDETTGVTIMRMDEGLDTGDVLWTRELPIEPGETADRLGTRLAALGAEALVEALGRLRRDGLVPQPQDEDRATYAPRLRKGDGRIDWTRPADYLERQVRAMHPWPGTTTQWNGKPLKILPPVRVVRGAEPGARPGEVLDVGPPIVVAAGSGALAVQRVQPAGKRPMDAADFVRGYRLRVGEVLGA